MKKKFDAAYKQIVNEEDAADMIDRVLNERLSDFLERMSDEELEVLHDKVFDSVKLSNDAASSAAHELLYAIEFIQSNREGDSDGL